MITKSKNARGLFSLYTTGIGLFHKTGCGGIFLFCILIEFRTLQNRIHPLNGADIDIAIVGNKGTIELNRAIQFSEKSVIISDPLIDNCVFYSSLFSNVEGILKKSCLSVSRILFPFIRFAYHLSTTIVTDSVYLPTPRTVRAAQ
jgi:hypothetical protein